MRRLKLQIEVNYESLFYLGTHGWFRRTWINFYYGNNSAGPVYVEPSRYRFSFYSRPLSDIISPGRKYLIILSMSIYGIPQLTGSKQKIIDLYDFLSKYPSSFFLTTNRGPDIWSMSERGSRNAYVYISRFPNLIKYIQKNENNISSDMWGMLYDHPLGKNKLGTRRCIREE